MNFCYLSWIIHIEKEKIVTKHYTLASNTTFSEYCFKKYFTHNFDVVVSQTHADKVINKHRSIKLSY